MQIQGFAPKRNAARSNRAGEAKKAYKHYVYLDEADQEIVQEIMDRDQISPSLSQAQKLHRLAQIDKIDDSAIETVMTVEKPMYETITFRRNTVEKYFPAGTSGKEIEQIIIQLLENYSRQREAKKTYDHER